MAAAVVEQILLGDAGVRAERFGADAGQEDVHRAAHPDVDGKRVEAVQAVEEDALGHLRPHAVDFPQRPARLGKRQPAGGGEVEPGGDLPGCVEDVPGAEAAAQRREVGDGDRIILCSDGLSGMIGDGQIESLAVSSATPQQAADNLVAAALTAGGADNVTVVVIDVLDDGVAEAARKTLLRRAGSISAVILGVMAAVVLIAMAFVRSEWYLGVNGSTVGLYRGINGSFFGVSMSELVGTSAVELSDLPVAVQDQLENGIRVDSEEAGRAAIDSYHEQINAEKDRAAEIAETARSETDESAGEGADQKATTTDGGDLQ